MKQHSDVSRTTQPDFKLKPAPLGSTPSRKPLILQNISEHLIISSPDVKRKSTGSSSGYQRFKDILNHRQVKRRSLQSNTDHVLYLHISGSVSISKYPSSPLHLSYPWVATEPKHNTNSRKPKGTTAATTASLSTVRVGKQPVINSLASGTFPPISMPSSRGALW